MSSALPPCPEPVVRVADGTPERRIRGGSMHTRVGGKRADRIRAREVVRLICEQRMSRADAFWCVASSPEIGIPQFIELAAKQARPRDATLDRRCMNLFERVAPHEVQSALADVRLVLTHSALPAARMLAANASRTVADKDLASGVSAQTKAAELLFRALGVVGTGAGTQVNTQVNVNLDGHLDAQRKAREILEGRTAIDTPVTRIEDRAPPPAERQP
jgi:hypothetical protein